MIHGFSMGWSSKNAKSTSDEKVWEKTAVARVTAAKKSVVEPLSSGSGEHCVFSRRLPVRGYDRSRQDRRRNWKTLVGRFGGRTAKLCCHSNPALVRWLLRQGRCYSAVCRHAARCRLHRGRTNHGSGRIRRAPNPGL